MKAEKLKKDGKHLDQLLVFQDPPPTPPVNKSEMKKYETENKKAPSKAKELPLRS